jgi:hypothetical protein
MHPSSNNCHRKQNPSKKKKKTNKGPGSLTDIENKTHPKKKKNKKTKVRAVPGNCPDRQTDTHTHTHL